MTVTRSVSEVERFADLLNAGFARNVAASLRDADPSRGATRLRIARMARIKYNRRL